MAFGGDNAESYYDEGLTALMKGDVKHAATFFTRAIDKDRSMLAAYHQLGRCYIRTGQLRQAVEILDRVVSSKPDLVPARLDLGQALLAVGAVDRARQQFSEILSMQPSNGRAHLGMAQACFQEGNWSAAVTLAQGARAHGGPNFSVLFLLGRAARLAGNNVLAEQSLQEAQNLIEKSVELSPDSPEGYFLRGEVAFAQEHFASALEHFRAAEDRVEPERCYSAFGENFGRVDVMAKRALCYQRLGNIDAAREVGKQILAMAPDHRLGHSLSQL